MLLLQDFFLNGLLRFIFKGGTEKNYVVALQVRILNKDLYKAGSFKGL